MRLELGIAQKQIITQQMIQTLNILEMNVQQMEEYLSGISMENPVMDLQESEAGRAQEYETQHKQEELARKLEWLSSTDRQNSVYYEDDDSDDNRDNLQDISAQGEDLAGYLRSQLLFKKYDETDREISEYLLASLDSRGYLTETAASVAPRFSAEPERVQRLISDIKQLDPAGVGASDLRECLLLQLRRCPVPSPLAETLTADWLPEIAKNHMDIIARKLGVTADEIRAACDVIRTLNPKPGNAYSDRSHLAYVQPDVMVVKLEGHFEILVNDYRYPRITVNSYYQQLADNPPDDATAKYLKEKLAQVKSLSQDMKNRTSTLASVARILVERQNAFFRLGPGNRRPLRLKDISEELSIHESTVSRTLQNKYLQCSYGIFPLNYFLTSAAAVDTDSGEVQTPEQIKDRIRQVVDAENKKKPLSDDKICAELLKYNIKIARRTVNKYRQELGIPDKSGRKEL